MYYIGTLSETISYLKKFSNWLEIIPNFFGVPIVFILIYIVFAIRTKKISKQKTMEKIGKLININKYVPDLFFETNETRENLRYFYNKKWIKRIKKYFKIIFESYYGKLLKEIFKNNKKEFTIKKFEKNDNIDIKLDKLLLLFSAIQKCKIKVSEKYKKTIYLFTQNMRQYIEYINDLKQKLNLINNDIVFLIGKAGAGKTSIVCHICESLIKSNKKVIFLEIKEINKNIKEELLQNIGLPKMFLKEEFLELVYWITFNIFFRNAYIFIDGLNENKELKLYDDLINFYNTKPKNTRVLTTCRSEYFEARYKEEIIEKVSKKQHVYNIEDGRIYDIAYESMLNAYSKAYNYMGKISESVKRDLIGNKLLTKIFFEVYRDSDTDALDLDSSNLFEKYIKIVAKGKVKELYNILMKIGKKMVETKIYNKIPVDFLKENENKVFKSLDENLILFKNIEKNSGELDVEFNEIIQFVYDEFRDYIIAKYIVSEAIQNIEGLYKIIKEIDNNKDVCEEGVIKYLYIYYKNNKAEKICELLFNNFIKKIELNNKWWGDEYNYAETVIMGGNYFYIFEKDYILYSIKSSTMTHSSFLINGLIRNEIENKGLKLDLLYEDIKNAASKKEGIYLLKIFMNIFNNKEKIISLDKILLKSETGINNYRKLIFLAMECLKNNKQKFKISYFENLEESKKIKNILISEIGWL